MIKIELTKLKEGDKGCVVELLSSGAMRRRLQDLGLVAGTQVKCLLKSPYGDPVAYLIRGAVIALRYEDAKQIIITYN